jgi:hypothetical protein
MERVVSHYWQQQHHLSNNHRDEIVWEIVEIVFVVDVEATH